jgi:hypothetical protein
VNARSVAGRQRTCLAGSSSTRAAHLGQHATFAANVGGNPTSSPQIGHPTQATASAGKETVATLAGSVQTGVAGRLFTVTSLGRSPTGWKRTALHADANDQPPALTRTRSANNVHHFSASYCVHAFVLRARRQGRASGGAGERPRRRSRAPHSLARIAPAGRRRPAGNLATWGPVCKGSTRRPGFPGDRAYHALHQ